MLTAEGVPVLAPEGLAALFPLWGYDFPRTRQNPNLIIEDPIPISSPAVVLVFVLV
jgi:hypothetical protein